MTRMLVLGLVVAGLFALPGAGRASNVAPSSMFIADTVFARQWAPARVHSHRPARAVIVTPRAVVGRPVVAVQPQAVWVEPGWAWDGWQWVWVPGHWAW